MNALTLITAQCSDLNYCSKEVKTELVDRLRVRISHQSPATETNSASQSDGCCGDNEANNATKVESVQQSHCVSILLKWTTR